MGNTLEALRIALDMERSGYKTYIAAAKNTSNKLGESTLEAIAAKELDHIKAIEGFCLLPQTKNPDTDKLIGEIKHRDKKCYVRVIMEKLGSELQENVKKDDNLSAAYKTAMELEKESYLFYKNLLEEASLPEVKALFKFLMGEENIHYELFQETLEYLDHPGDWFKEQERWIVEG